MNVLDNATYTYKLRIPFIWLLLRNKIYKNFGAGILAEVDRGLRVLWHRNTSETSKRLWPLTATAGISTGHKLTRAEIVVLQDRCFHSYDDELYAEVGKWADISTGGGNKEVVMSIVDSGRGSLRSGSVGETMLGGSVWISLLGGSIESWSGGGIIIVGSFMEVLGGSGELNWCRGSMGRKQRTWMPGDMGWVIVISLRRRLTKGEGESEITLWYTR